MYSLNRAGELCSPKGREKVHIVEVDHRDPFGHWRSQDEPKRDTLGF